MDYINKTREFNSETQVNTETWDYIDGSKGIKISYWNENRSIYTRTYMNGNREVTKLNSNGSESYHMECPPQPEMPRVYKTYAPLTYVEPEPKEPKKAIGRPPLNKPKVEKKAIGRPSLRTPEETQLRNKLLKQITYKKKYYNLVLHKEDYMSKTNKELELYITQLKK